MEANVDIDTENLSPKTLSLAVIYFCDDGNWIKRRVTSLSTSHVPVIRMYVGYILLRISVYVFCMNVSTLNVVCNVHHVSMYR